MILVRIVPIRFSSKLGLRERARILSYSQIVMCKDEDSAIHTVDSDWTCDLACDIASLPSCRIFTSLTGWLGLPNHQRQGRNFSHI